MNDAECELIEQECVEKVRKALKTLTSGEIYDRKGYLNEAGYNALKEIEGLDLFWICDPLIKLAKKGGTELYREETCKSKDSCDDYKYWHCVGCNGCKKGGKE